MPLHDDAYAFPDQTVAEFFQRSADPTVLLDQVLIEREGLREFIPRAWHTVEGMTPYKSNWHIDAICEYLEAVTLGQIKRLAIAVPPRHMKSVSVAQMWPAWHWTKKAHSRFLFSSYAAELAKKDSVACRRIIASPWYQQRWGDRFRLTSDMNTKMKFENDHGGSRLTTSVGGQLTGFGANFVVVDDPLNSKDAESQTRREGVLRWWKESMSTRLNDPANDAFVIIMQRLHENDLVGHILKTHGTIEDEDGEWDYLCLPAEYEPDHPNRWFRDPRAEMPGGGAGALLWPAHIPKLNLESLKKSLGPYATAGQLQQRPAPREGGTFKRSWLKVVDVLPADVTFARGWDLAASEKKVVSSDPDYTATALLAFSRSARRWYIVDIKRWREGPAEIERHIKQTAEADRMFGRHVKISIPQDPGQAGKAQAGALLLMLAGEDVKAEPQSGEKMVRAMGFASQAAGGFISILKGDWNEDFLSELASFPAGAHDDQIDAVASAFNRLTGGTTGLLEWYARVMDEDAKAEAEAAATLAANGGVHPALVVHEEDTSDMGRAMTAGSLFAASR